MAWSQKLGRKGTTAPAPGWQTGQWETVGQYTKGERKKKRTWALGVKNVTVATRQKKKIKAHQDASGRRRAAKAANLCAPHIPA